jgi:hypothetical protein
MIVGYTNDYGGEHCKEWQPIDQNDLLDFIAVLFLMSIQKRKDIPSNWFSSDPYLESPQAKRIMSGKKFSRMLRYIHCCSLDPPPGPYDPVHKVKDVMDYILKRSKKLFSPGEECLSLDETLIRAFGRIKFKVRIISKSARYGIKIYVVTDARTSYVLQVIVYTGKNTNETEDGMKKTVQVVTKLLEDYMGTNRHVFVDRFYTSLELLRVLDANGIKMTGTVMGNRLPKGVRVAKASQEFKSMARGDATKYRLVYKNSSGEDVYAGLVVWKDSTMVYCLSNGCNNFGLDNCNRRLALGTVVIPRPSCISRYNENMGGVDLADMRRLHCNSTIMGQKRWWLKLFFYMLDVGTSNSLVLHNEKRNDNLEQMNISSFKKALIDQLLGDRIKCVSVNPVIEHVAVRMEGNSRSTFVFCALQGSSCRTRFICQACLVPLCCAGSGRTVNDCFSIAHSSKEMCNIVVGKYDSMKKRMRNTNKKRKSP